MLWHIIFLFMIFASHIILVAWIRTHVVIASSFFGLYLRLISNKCSTNRPWSYNFITYMNAVFRCVLGSLCYNSRQYRNKLSKFKSQGNENKIECKNNIKIWTLACWRQIKSRVQFTERHLMSTHPMLYWIFFSLIHFLLCHFRIKLHLE